MKEAGFTLIELLIVLTLIGILSLISLPSYSDHLTKVRRAHIITTLMDLAGRMEKYYNLKRTYNGATLENLAVTNYPYKNHYRLNIMVQDDFYTLEAVPIGKQQKDSLCATVTIDQNGNRNISGSGTVEQCWL